MHELAFLKELVIILGLAVIVVIAFHRLRLPPIAGLILSGVIVGPQGLALTGDVSRSAQRPPLRSATQSVSRIGRRYSLVW